MTRFTDDPTVLFAPEHRFDVIPDLKGKSDDAFNAAARFLLYGGFIGAVLFNSLSPLMLALLLAAVVAFVAANGTSEPLTQEPTEANPFMNELSRAAPLNKPPPAEYWNNDPESRKIASAVNRAFAAGRLEDSEDVSYFNRGTFHTVPQRDEKKLIDFLMKDLQPHLENMQEENPVYSDLFYDPGVTTYW